MAPRWEIKWFWAMRILNRITSTVPLFSWMTLQDCQRNALSRYYKISSITHPRNIDKKMQWDRICKFNSLMINLYSLHSWLYPIIFPHWSFHYSASFSIRCEMIRSRWCIWIDDLRSKYLKPSHLHGTSFIDEVLCMLFLFYLPSIRKDYSSKEMNPIINKWILKSHLDMFENNGMAELNPARGDKLGNTDSS